LYLSGSQGKVNIVRYMLGKKINLMARNYTDVGLDIFTRFKLPEEE